MELNVTIVDQSGKLLAGIKNDSSFSNLSSHQLEFQARVEKGLENRIRAGRAGRTRRTHSHRGVFARWSPPGFSWG